MVVLREEECVCFSVCMDVTVLYVKRELYLSVCVGTGGRRRDGGGW